MRLYLNGHDYKYAVEQMLLTMFPEERPEYPEGKPAGDRMEIRLSRGSRYTTAACALSSIWVCGHLAPGLVASAAYVLLFGSSLYLTKVIRGEDLRWLRRLVQAK